MWAADVALAEAVAVARAVAVDLGVVPAVAEAGEAAFVLEHPHEHGVLGDLREQPLERHEPALVVLEALPGDDHLCHTACIDASE